MTMRFTQANCVVAAVALACGLAGRTEAADAGIGPSFKGPVGLQLYSLREQFREGRARHARQKAGDFGFKNVELAGTLHGA